MNALMRIVLLAAIPGGCAGVQGPDDAMSPSAFAGAWAARCERQARVASRTAPDFPTPGVSPRGDFDTALDVNRQAYWRCINEMRP